MLLLEYTNGNATTSFTVANSPKKAESTKTPDSTKEPESDNSVKIADTATKNPATTKNVEKVASPNTGDITNTIVWIIMVFVSGMGIVSLIEYRKRRYL